MAMFSVPLKRCHYTKMTLSMQETEDLVRFTKEFLHGKLDFLCSAFFKRSVWFFRFTVFDLFL